MKLSIVLCAISSIHVKIRVVVDSKFRILIHSLSRTTQRGDGERGREVRAAQEDDGCEGEGDQDRHGDDA